MLHEAKGRAHVTKYWRQVPAINLLKSRAGPAAQTLLVRGALLLLLIMVCIFAFGSYNSKADTLDRISKADTQLKQVQRAKTNESDATEALRGQVEQTRQAFDAQKKIYDDLFAGRLPIRQGVGELFASVPVGVTVQLLRAEEDGIVTAEATVEKLQDVPIFLDALTGSTEVVDLISADWKPENTPNQLIITFKVK